MDRLLEAIGLHFAFSDGTKDGKFDFSQYRNPDSYDMETRKIIDTVTIQDNINPVGSQKFKVHRYPGDVDIFEPIKVCCSLDTATQRIVEGIQQMIGEIGNNPEYYMGDFKAGLDDRYLIDVDQNQERLIETIMNLFQNNLLNNNETGMLVELIKNKQIDDIKEILRKHSIVRWNEQELLKGVKILPNNKRLKLFDAIKHNTIVKLDLWAPINGNYTEITNFMLLTYIDNKGHQHPINITLDDRIKSLIRDIKMYSSPSHLKSLKVAKRMWALAQVIDDKKTMRKLYPLFSSDAAMLSQITSEIETLCNMLSKLKEPPMDMIIKQIDRFKTRIGNVFLEVDESNIFDDINMIVKSYMSDKRLKKGDLSNIVKILQRISGSLSITIEKYTHLYLKKYNLDDPEYYDYLLDD